MDWFAQAVIRNIAAQTMLFEAQAMHEMASAYLIFAFTATIILAALACGVYRVWQWWPWRRR